MSALDLSHYAPGIRHIDRPGRIAEEFNLIKGLLTTSPEFGAFYESERGKIQRPVEWLHDPNLPPGINGAALHYAGYSTIHLPTIPPDDPFLVAHELEHCVLVDAGFKHAESAHPENRELCAALNSALADPLVNQRLAYFGFDIAARWHEEAAQARASLEGLSEPTNKRTRLRWALNYLSLVYEYRAATGEATPEEFHGWFMDAFPRIAQEAGRIGRMFGRHDLTTQEGYNRALLDFFRRFLKLSPTNGDLLLLTEQVEPSAPTHNGTTWTEVQISADYDTNFASLGGSVGIALNPHNAGEGYASIYTGTTPYAPAAMRRTTDHGATWSSFTPSTNLGNALAICIVVPYQATDFETIYYVHTTGSGTFDPRLYRTNNSGTTDISPVISGAQYAPHAYTRAFSVCDNDRNTGMLCGIREFLLGEPRIVAISRNLEAASPTWTVLLGPDASINYREVYAAAKNRFYLIGENAAIGFSDGNTVDSRQGNLPSLTNGRVVGICGG